MSQIKVFIPPSPGCNLLPAESVPPGPPCPVLPALFRVCSAMHLPTPPPPQVSIAASLGGDPSESPTPLLLSPKGGHGIVSFCSFSLPPQTLGSLPAPPPQPPRFQGAKVKKVRGLRSGTGLFPGSRKRRHRLGGGGGCCRGMWDPKKSLFFGGGGIAEEGGQQDGRYGMGAVQHPS